MYSYSGMWSLAAKTQSIIYRFQSVQTLRPAPDKGGGGTPQPDVMESQLIRHLRVALFLAKQHYSTMHVTLV